MPYIKRLLKKLISKSLWLSRGMGIFVLTLVFVLSSSLPLMKSVDEWVYQLSSRFGPQTRPSEQVIVIHMDPKARQEWGNHLPRSVMADAISSIRKSKPAAIGVVTELSGTQDPAAQKRLQSLQKLNVDQALNKRQRSLAKQYKQQLSSLEKAIDGDAQLSRQLQRSKQPILAYLAPDGFGQSPDTIDKKEQLPQIKDLQPYWQQLPDWILGRQLEQVEHVLLPQEAFLKYSGIGLYEPNRLQQPLIYRNGGQLMPSFALRLVARANRVRPTRLGLIADRGVNIAAHSVRTDSRFYLYPTFYQQSLKQIDMSRLLNGKVKRSELRGKVIIVEGSTSYNQIDLPNGLQVTPAQMQAQLVSSIMNQDFYVQPEYSRLIQWLLLALGAFYLWWLLPRVKIKTAAWMTLSIVSILMLSEWMLMILSRQWWPVALPAVFLLVGYLLLSARQLRRYWTFMLTAQHGANAAYSKLGQVQQQQGNLDEAFNSLRNCQATDDVLASLYDLALAYERKRQFNKAASVFSYIQELQFDYQDVKERIKRMREMENAVARGVTQGAAAATMIISGDGIESPRLGRYQVESRLGRGAMGTVYLAQDPRIGRQVAIKTIALNAEFEADEIQEAKERFYREAEAAGRLSHANIVTVYDVGEEEDLAYIAMDYLQGVNLSVYAKPEQLLPVDTVLSIGEQVADALDYAHNNKVIHRDIKPGNIIYEPKTGKVSVTDFGIASLTDSSKTKTGTILGTPSYMSPEQISGKRVDGRSDIFSLAVMMYLLLSGRLPFEGDSLAALMFKIANEKHLSIRRVRDDLPACISTILNKALQKELDKRYETAGQFAQAIRKCRESL
ncbi:MAG: protein kinase [Gammaproteobacteria bacterium]|nr:protein kinase [Gammaproteobacteria bacterium]